MAVMVDKFCLIIIHNGIVREVFLYNDIKKAEKEFVRRLEENSGWFSDIDEAVENHYAFCNDLELIIAYGKEVD